MRWDRLLEVTIPSQTIKVLLRDGVTQVDVEPYARKATEILKRGCQKYTEELPRIFASKADRFKDTSFKINFDPETISSLKSRAWGRRIGTAEEDFILLSKAEGKQELVVSLVVGKGKSVLPAETIEEIISDGIIDLLFEKSFPTPFIASAERTGAAIFRKELNFARNRLLEEMSRMDGEIDPMELLFKSYQDYPLPVKINVDFIRQLESIAKKDSFIVQNSPQILNDFLDIVGGEYIAGSNDTIYFKPVRKQAKLTMDESSSAVRSLLDMGFYLRHVAKPGDLLMVDEPELNLHPENQRRMARLFTRLVNLGIRVFVTTQQRLHRQGTQHLDNAESGQALFKANHAKGMLSTRRTYNC